MLTLQFSYVMGLAPLEGIKVTKVTKDVKDIKDAQLVKLSLVQ